MLFGTKNNLENLILMSLQAKPLTGPLLKEKIKETLPHLSKETFYRVLRALLMEEVLVKNKSVYAINHHWMEKLAKFSAGSGEKSFDSENILSFKDGDRITYHFKNPNLMGVYWAHTYDLVFKVHDPKIPILIYHPHEWLILGRPEAESHFLTRFSRAKKRVHFAIGGTTDLDRAFKKEWGSTHVEIGTGIDLGLSEDTYINVLGDYIFKVTVGSRFAKDIDTFFKTHTTMTDEASNALARLIARDEHTKFAFKRSTKEAALWRSRFGKYFHLPRQ